MTDKTMGHNGWIYGIALCAAMACAGAGRAQTASDSSRVYNIEEVVVTGSNSATERNLLPYTVSVVDGRRLEATGRTQLLSALSGRVPGLFVTERNIFGFGISNGGSGGIKIRGVGGEPTNAILMMVDGQPQFAGVYSHSVADFYETEYGSPYLRRHPKNSIISAWPGSRCTACLSMPSCAVWAVCMLPMVWRTKTMFW